MRRFDPEGNRLASIGGSRLITRAPLPAFLLSLSMAVPGAGAPAGGIPGQAGLSFGESRDTGEEAKKATRLGHIIPGMDREQVLAELGEPIRKFRSSKTAGVEHWFYRMEKLHQERLRGRGWSFVRITFLDGRVIALDPR